MTRPFVTMLINIRPLPEMSNRSKTTQTSGGCSNSRIAKLILYVAHTLHDDFVCHIAILAYSENVTLAKGYVDVVIK